MLILNSSGYLNLLQHGEWSRNVTVQLVLAAVPVATAGICQVYCHIWNAVIAVIAVEAVKFRTSALAWTHVN